MAVVSRRGLDRVRAGHPWIYQSDIIAVDADPGDLVRVVSERKRAFGLALWSSTSVIALRFVGNDVDAGDERAWLSSRVRAASAYRDTLGIDGSAWRVVHAEADRLPGLVVDRYGDDTDVYLVVQTLCQGMDRRLDMLVDVLSEQWEPRGIIARNDPRVRRLEGLDERVAVVAGEVPEFVEVREGRVRLRADLRRGQKTGLFLDQRENHQVLAGYARGRALDGFAYQGAFALAMAGSADSVLALDSSEAAVRAVVDHAGLNGLTNLDVRQANVFDELRALVRAGERFDTIVLDPPAFARNKAALERAVAGYKEINLQAIKLLATGGTLMTCSCSHHVDEVRLLAIVREAAADAGATMRVLERRLQSRDHPILLAVPETQYLKALVLERVS
jgi:23S rRNA (cytosine1962-C5)-methyltransferase